jgi:hypothetical protein
MLSIHDNFIVIKEIKLAYRERNAELGVEANQSMFDSLMEELPDEVQLNAMRSTPPHKLTI